ncbi:hypothetical protein VMCG_00378 [Cytospora schulzeri]|uniref:RRM domain-containing protein n=1 Tax=Cytospora schulzeri TaxID=448051 RepID=A0A423X8G3_9PEZI|nr:hypothetical protein VMCG_00378 [Valsa malicola]
MSSSTGGHTVTIDRSYFDTLVRRANFNTDDAITNPVLSIPKSEYDGLNHIAAKYANLRQNLLRGGVGEETIDLLSQDDATIEEQRATAAPAPTNMADPHVDVHPSVPPQAPVQDFRGVRNGNGLDNYKPHSKAYGHVHTHEVPDWADVDAAEDDESDSGGGPVDDYQNPAYNHQASMRPFYERQCARSILLTNLAEGVTHGDITEAVRGGQLLDIYMRPDRAVTVSFLLASDARAFFDHVRRHDLYIRHKRVDVRWNDRQFILPGHVASKIGIGATRNLILRRCDPRFTEESIREDLDHIHNLVVIKVDFMGGSCYIKTNSVHNAMFARTCMMSRAKYKGCKIDWDSDECAQPFEQLTQAKSRKDNPPAKKTNGKTMANRFHLLNLEDDGDEDEISPEFSAKKTVGIAA